MGQALRRAAAKTRSSSTVKTTSSPIPKTIVNKRPPVFPAEPRPDITKPAAAPDAALDSDVNAGTPPNDEHTLEERDPKFDVMLNQMVGRIQSKPGGKPEMGEAQVVEKYRRPMPKLRNTNSDSSRFEDRAAPPGTLNVTQLRHIIMLHQGKADDHNGPMEVQKIAERFRVDVAEVQKIVRFVSLPPEDTSKQEDNP